MINTSATALTDPTLFDLDPQQLAIWLLGKVLRHRVPLEGPRAVGDQGAPALWLSARIIETEAYYLQDRASHSSLGMTPSRAPMFMAPGTIYMYHSRGGASLNFSARGDGNAVLIKSGLPVLDEVSGQSAIDLMLRLNPARNGSVRPVERLCSGQSLLCRALGLQIAAWNGRTLDPRRFYLDDTGYVPEVVLQCRRLGLRPDRDADLPFRFIDASAIESCTQGSRGRRTDTRIQLRRGDLPAPWLRSE